MGRWAQARRRASAGVAGELLPPPAAPTLDTFEERVYVTTNEPTNVGSVTTLWSSFLEFGPWTLADTEPTDSPTDFGDTSSYYQKYLVARELGNGIDFGGSSPDSNKVYIS